MVLHVFGCWVDEQEETTFLRSIHVCNECIHTGRFGVEHFIFCKIYISGFQIMFVCGVSNCCQRGRYQPNDRWTNESQSNSQHFHQIIRHLCCKLAIHSNNKLICWNDDSKHFTQWIFFFLNFSFLVFRWKWYFISKPDWSKSKKWMAMECVAHHSDDIRYFQFSSFNCSFNHLLLVCVWIIWCESFVPSI